MGVLSRGNKTCPVLYIKFSILYVYEIQCDDEDHAVCWIRNYFIKYCCLVECWWPDLILCVEGEGAKVRTIVVNDKRDEFLVLNVKRVMHKPLQLALMNLLGNSFCFVTRVILQVRSNILKVALMNINVQSSDYLV